jgi:uncharacterized integral membrane protein
MMKFLKSLILLPVAIVAILLAVANRAPVTVSLDPFSKGSPEISFALPLFALIFAAIALGILIGGSAAWLAQAKHRRAERRFRREARHLRSQTEQMRSEAAPRPGPSGLPALALPSTRR